jgi:hypothetical protein
VDEVLVLRVECYAGYMGEQTPRVLHLGEAEVRVAEVLDQWLAPTHRYFKLLGKDGHTYIVRHDTLTGAWEMTMFLRRRESQ